MQFILSALSLVAAASIAFAGVIPDVPDAPVSEYQKLLDMCNAKENAYVAVKYEDDYTTFEYDQCYPYQYYRDDGTVNHAMQAVFCRSVTCNSNPHPNCTGGAVPPIPVPLPALMTLVDANDWVEVLGQGAMCERNSAIGNVVDGPAQDVSNVIEH